MELRVSVKRVVDSNSSSNSSNSSANNSNNDSSSSNISNSSSYNNSSSNILSFVVYDSHCLECPSHGGTCSRRGDVCFFADRCHRPGEVHPEDPCVACAEEDGYAIWVQKQGSLNLVKSIAWRWRSQQLEECFF